MTFDVDIAWFHQRIQLAINDLSGKPIVRLYLQAGTYVDFCLLTTLGFFIDTLRSCCADMWGQRNETVHVMRHYVQRDYWTYTHALTWQSCNRRKAGRDLKSR